MISCELTSRISEYSWRRLMKFMMGTYLRALYVATAIGLALLCSSLAVAANPPKPTISEDAGAAVGQMGKALLAKEFSFQGQTIRPYTIENGVLLHIEHDFKI